MENITIYYAKITDKNGQEFRYKATDFKKIKKCMAMHKGEIREVKYAVKEKEKKQ